MKQSQRAANLLLPAICAVLLAACGGGSDATSSSGALSLKITDAPVDSADAVVVVFTGVELKPQNGPAFSVDFSTPKSIDLYALQGGVTRDLLDNQTVPAGQYEWLRLKVRTDDTASDASYIEIDGAVYNLRIPSGAQTGLKLVRSFTVAQGGVTGFVIDFDLRKSIVAPPGQSPNMLLKPVLRIFDELQTGTIAGRVDLAALATAQLPQGAPITDCNAGLYLFDGGAAVPDDFDRDDSADDDGGTDPVWFQPLVNDGVTTTSNYSIPFVEAGRSYSLALTCDYDVDGVDSNDYRPDAVQGENGFETMRWTITPDIAVTAGQTTTVDLP